ncbi:zinc-binding dehydrogenase [Sphingobium sp. HBC34]|uniref:Zinc-binding dehydrogenase n=1 Tax=Sphingobium cyanobacteriorum TaxID=3063954 RepID=A0ABT8ZPY7_9SPHN|nr:zinc-binding dehydrogenase [Sphingobium sp. HBC34]MDO7836138.1 zinc-binding dehydrogenase [Sphingobium sp. HBC34]
MTTHRALVFSGVEHAEIAMLPTPEPGEMDLVIEAECSLISSGTERSFFQAPPFTPFLPGYSLVGRVVRTGALVREFAIGDRVIASAPHQAMALCHAHFAVKIDEELDGAQASFFNIAAMAIHAIRLSGIGLGDPVLLLGQGLIGLVAVQVARIAGAAPIFSVDIDPQRLELSRHLGADAVFHAIADKERLHTAVAALPGKGPAATIELTGRPDTIEHAIDLTRRGGTIVPGSMSLAGHGVNIFGRAWIEGLKIVGSYFNARPWDVTSIETTPPTEWPLRIVPGEAPADLHSSRSDMRLFLRLLSLQRLSIAPLVTDRVAPEDAAQQFAALVGPDKLGTVIDWKC